MIEFIIPSLGQKKDKVVAPPLPKDKGIMTSGKFIFYSSMPTNNMRHQGKVASFRNHVFRTNDEELANWLEGEFINTKRQLPFEIKKVTEQEFQDIMRGIEEDNRPKDPMEGKIEPLPLQNFSNDPGIDGELSAEELAKKKAETEKSQQPGNINIAPMGDPLAQPGNTTSKP